MRVLQEGGFEVWIFDFDPPKHVRCYIGEFEAIIDLNAPFRPKNLDEGERDNPLIGKSLRVVQRNLGLLLEKWDEMNS